VAHLARQRRKLANRRKSYLHQLTAAIAARFGATAVEELHLRQRHGRTSRQKHPAEGRAQQGDPRGFAGHDDRDAALQG
jgi:hypothetical protein